MGAAGGEEDWGGTIPASRSAGSPTRPSNLLPLRSRATESGQHEFGGNGHQRSVLQAAANSELTDTTAGRRLSVPTSDLLTAYNAAAAGDTIELEAGTTFLPSATLTITKAVRIQCLGSDTTCPLDGSNDKRIIIVNSGTSGTTEFKGLLFTKGYVVRLIQNESTQQFLHEKSPVFLLTILTPLLSPLPHVALNKQDVSIELDCGLRSMATTTRPLVFSPLFSPPLPHFLLNRW